jgi:hypothetical protein
MSKPHSHVRKPSDTSLFPCTSPQFHQTLTL